MFQREVVLIMYIFAGSVGIKCHQKKGKNWMKIVSYHLMLWNWWMWKNKYLGGWKNVKIS